MSAETKLTAHEVLYNRLVVCKDGFYDDDGYNEYMSEGVEVQYLEAMEQFANQQTASLQKEVDLFKKEYDESQDDLKAVMKENLQLKQVAEQMVKELKEASEWYGKHEELEEIPEVVDAYHDAKRSADKALKAYQQLMDKQTKDEQRG